MQPISARPLAEAHVDAHAAGVAERTTLYGGRKAPLKLHVLIVGCGLGGVAAAHCFAQAGHRVTLLESAPAIGDVGAGIQVTPNVARLLIRWGLRPQLDATGVRPDAIVFRRYCNGEIVGYTNWKTMEEDHGSPYYHIHRSDFHRMLFDLAAPYVDLRLNAHVTSIDPYRPSVTLKSGETISGDLIVGADGVKSYIRTVVIGEADHPKPTGDAAYRALIPSYKLREDPELRPFVEGADMTAWMAPGRHLMAYNIRAKQEYNLVLLHPDDGSVESWTAEGSADKMRKDFDDFDPRIKRMLKLVESTLKWRLMDRDPLEKWIHDSGRVVLLGDSCHPMLPYRAQGAAMAIEDAAVLGNLFTRVSSPAQISALLAGYQVLRYARTTNTQASSRLNQRIFHLPDGPEQEARDNAMRQAMADAASDSAGSPNQWADKAKNAEQFSYDADAEAERWWEAHASEVNQLGERLKAKA